MAVITWTGGDITGDSVVSTNGCTLQKAIHDHGSR